MMKAAAVFSVCSAAIVLTNLPQEHPKVTTVQKLQ